MKTLYLDCKNGVCADMIISGLRALGAETEAGFEEDMSQFIHRVIEHGEYEQGDHHESGESEHCCNAGAHHAHGDEKGHLHHLHSHGVSYAAIKEVLGRAPMTESAKQTAQKIYETIARAEARVHKATLETVHFHEVGRAEAIINIAKAAAMLDSMGVDKIVCSEVCDGCGTIECSHGIIPVPVPAVKAMMDSCDYVFKTEPVSTELVTPSGLGMLIGMGAECAPRPEGSIIAKGIGYGGRDTGRGGMEIYIIEEE